MDFISSVNSSGFFIQFFFFFDFFYYIFCFKCIISQIEIPQVSWFYFLPVLLLLLLSLWLVVVFSGHTQQTNKQKKQRNINNISFIFMYFTLNVFYLTSFSSTKNKYFLSQTTSRAAQHRFCKIDWKQALCCVCILVCIWGGLFSILHLLHLLHITPHMTTDIDKHFVFINYG